MDKWVTDNKGAGTWDFEQQKDKPHYNEGNLISNWDNPIWDFEKQKGKYAYNDGDILTSDINPVWPIGSRAGLPAAQAEKHIPCGYWFDSPQVQTYVPYIPFNIVNFDGETATDTILRDGTLTYKAVGEGSPSVTWAVSVDAGSTLGGSTITPEGVLTAGPTSCGTLKVTASSPGYGTSDTQYVRVTDAGQWILISTPCMCIVGCGTTCWAYFYEGKMRYDEKWGGCYAGSEPNCTINYPPCAGATVYTTSCKSCGAGTHSCIVGQNIYEWRC